jgi:hypothetical protein
MPAPDIPDEKGIPPAKNFYFLAPVFVTFLEGLIGPGGFVWAGNSSPWGWE